jgi:hypothetical protein
MRMNPDGRSHVDFVTVTAEGIPPEDWFGGIETIPVARTISAMSIIIATPPIRSFRERIIGSALKDGFLEPQSAKQIYSEIGLLELANDNGFRRS